MHRFFLLAAGLAFLAASAAPSRALDPGQPIDRYGHDAWGLAEGLPQSTVQEIAPRAIAAKNLHMRYLFNPAHILI